MKRKIIYLFQVLIMMVGLPAMAQQQIDEYLTIGAKNNPGLRASFNRYLAALERIPQAGALPDPTVAFGYFIQPIETRVGAQQAKLSASQMFPWFGTLKAKQDMATQQARAEFELFEEAKSNLFFNIRSNLYDLYFIQRAIIITGNNLQLLETLHELALEQISTGKASASDAWLIEMEILETSEQVRELNDEFHTHATAFNNFLNVETTADITIPDQPDTLFNAVNFESVMDSILLRNHRIRSLSYEESAMGSQQLVSRKMGHPDLSLGMEYFFINQSSNPTLPAGESGRDAILFPKVGLSLPIYRNKYKAMVREAHYRQEAVQFAKEDKINTITTQYTDVYATYKEAKRRITLQKKQLNLAKRSLVILQSEYTNDQRDMEELLNMEQKVLRYQLDLERSTRDLQVAIAQLKQLMGH